MQINAARKLLLSGTLLTALAAAACSGNATSDDVNSPSEPSNGATAAPSPTPSPPETPQYAALSTAPDFTLPNANGEQVTLSNLSAEKPVVLVFYRAFW